jgi:hypothetical protein
MASLGSSAGGPFLPTVGRACRFGCGRPTSESTSHVLHQRAWPANQGRRGNGSEVEAAAACFGRCATAATLLLLLLRLDIRQAPISGSTLRPRPIGFGGVLPF